ncbi:MAG: RDD family protein [Haliangiales bacterium]
MLSAGRAPYNARMSLDESAAAPSRRSQRAPAPRFYAGGFWRRAGASLADLAVIVPVALLLSWTSGQLTGVHLPESRRFGLDFWLDLFLAGDPAFIGIIVLLLATAALYALVFQVTWSATPGMRLVGLHIIDLYGDAPTVARAVVRTAGYLASAATLGLGFLWIGFDGERRGLHDWLSGTHVVRA